MKTAINSTTPDDVKVQSRCVEHCFDESIPRVWANNNPVITAFYHALSTIIPEGERFFMQSVHAVIDQVEDEKLRQEVKGFTAQEGSHCAEHNNLNNWINSQGYPVEQFAKVPNRILKTVRKVFSRKQQLAFTLAVEHLSALLTDQFLRRDELKTGLHPVMCRFFIWHSIEENEHKAVPFDVYQMVYGGYWTRIFQLVFVMLFFVPSVAWVQCLYLRHDRQLFNIKAWVEATSYFWVGPAWFLRITPGFYRYFRPNFHPWQSDNRALINKSLHDLTGNS